LFCDAQAGPFPQGDPVEQTNRGPAKYYYSGVDDGVEGPMVPHTASGQCILSKNGLSAGQEWEMNQRPQLEGANAVRFWAAVSIVLFHLALLPKKDLPAFLWVIPSFGGFGAPLFYVLSAFALSYGYYGSLETGAAIRRFYTRVVEKRMGLALAALLYAKHGDLTSESKKLSLAATG
jgi:hypothetical protein